MAGMDELLKKYGELEKENPEPVPIRPEPRVPLERRTPVQHETQVPPERRTPVQHETQVPSERRTPVQHETQVPSERRAPVQHETQVPPERRALAQPEAQVPPERMFHGTAGTGKGARTPLDRGWGSRFSPTSESNGFFVGKRSNVNSRSLDLPPLWGVDLALGLATLIGVVLILINLTAILDALAMAVCAVASAVFSLFAIITLILLLVFLRRRRWW